MVLAALIARYVVAAGEGWRDEPALPDAGDAAVEPLWCDGGAHEDGSVLTPDERRGPKGSPAWASGSIAGGGHTG